MIEKRPAKWGRLAVISDGHDFRNSQVLVIPDDGSEPIELPVMDMLVTCDNLDIVRVRLEAAATEIDLSEGRGDERVHITGRAATPMRRLASPHISIAQGDEPVIAKGFIWRFGHDGPSGRTIDDQPRENVLSRCRLYLKGRRTAP